MKTELIGKRIIVISDDSKGKFGILKDISKGRYPYIVEFDNGSTYGVEFITDNT